MIGSIFEKGEINLDKKKTFLSKIRQAQKTIVEHTVAISKKKNVGETSQKKIIFEQEIARNYHFWPVLPTYV